MVRRRRGWSVGELSSERIGRPREPYIETLRGLACILLVSVHVVGDADEGLRLPTGHPLERLIWFFQPLRMPLFAFISGLVFDASTNSAADLKRSLLDKAQRLLVPLVTVGTSVFLVRAAFHGTPLIDLWQVYFAEYDQFWYLTASFTIMAVSLLLAFSLPLAEGAVVTVCFCASVLLYLRDIRIDPNWFSITKTFYLAPFFFLGQLFRRVRVECPATLRLHRLVVLAVWIACLIAVRQLRIRLPVLSFADQGLGMLLLSLALCSFFFGARWNVGWLARIGPYSYAIFLFHLFFTAGVRELLQRWGGVADPSILFACGLFMGVTGPMLLQRTLIARPWLAWAFLGQRRTREGSSRAVSGATTGRVPQV